MATPNEARTQIYNRLLNNYTTTPVLLQGESTDSPAHPNPWVRLSVQINNGGGLDSLGVAPNRVFRRSGTIAVQVFTPVGLGMEQGDLISQEIRDLFEAVSFEDIDTNDALIRESAPDGEWALHLVEVAFDYDERR